MESTDHLFRREAGRMVSALTRVFGLHNIALAEDVVQEAFCRAMEVWSFRGLPENPAAWLMTTAKHCALDAIRRERTAREFGPELGRHLQSEWTLAPVVEEYFGENLCGFSASEIASAFVSGTAAIEKRITRAKKSLAASEKLFDVTSGAQFSQRLPAVRRALYLLFSEGYHGASPDTAVRTELCREAMRLAAALAEHPLGSTPPTYALCALMALSAARLPARLNSAGNLVSLANQDRSLWDQELIGEGLHFLELSATGSDLSDYHIEASIAAVHAGSGRADHTDWAAIVTLYDTLMALRPSPIVALNRAIAIGQMESPERGLEEIDAIADRDRLATYPFYPAALGELELRRGRYAAASNHFRAAAALSRNPMERHFLEQRAMASDSGGAHELASEPWGLADAAPSVLE